MPSPINWYDGCEKKMSVRGDNRDPPNVTFWVIGNLMFRMCDNGY